MYHKNGKLILPEFGGSVEYFYGDQVRHIPTGKTGTIASFSKRHQIVSIRWDDNTGVSSDIAASEIELV